MLDTNNNDNTLRDLFNDKNANITISFQNINKNVEIFYNSNEKRISNEDKVCSTLIIYRPIMRTKYSLPQDTKNNIPQRPMISGIDMAIS